MTYFSVIIPLYNKSNYIKETLTSVINQTYVFFEIIIVDDGSTDDSLEVVQQFDDNRIKIFSKTNGGVSVARNFGVSKAQNEYIAFMDADDLWETNYLEEMAKMIRLYPESGMYGCGYQAVYSTKTVPYGTQLETGYITNYFEQVLKNGITWTSATVVPKTILNKIGGFPEGMVAGEDRYTWAKIAIQYPVACSAKLLASYNVINSGVNLRKGKVDLCEERWIDLYQEGEFYRNEFIASMAIEDGLRYIFGHHKQRCKEIVDEFSYTKLWRKSWLKLKILTKLPNYLIDLYFHAANYYNKLKTDR